MQPSLIFPTKSYYIGSRSNSEETNMNATQLNNRVKFVETVSDNLHEDSSAHQSSISTSQCQWWSWTFIWTMFPIFVFGCPVHTLVLNVDKSSNMFTWIKIMFAGSIGKCTCSIISFIIAVVFNVLCLYKVVLCLDSLFFTAVYEPSLYTNLIQSVKYALVLVPIDYFWLYGFKLHNLILQWNRLFEMHGGLACISLNFRLRLILLVAVFGGVFIVRHFTRLLYTLNSKAPSLPDQVEAVWEFLVELGHNLILPVYCGFCFAIRFHLSVMKLLIYQWTNDRVEPNVKHLKIIKQIYTEASDAILTVNSWCYFYMSFVIPVVILEAVIQSKLVAPGTAIPLYLGPLVSFVATLAGKEQMKTGTVETRHVRELNLEVAAFLAVMGIIYWVIWQASRTNDCSREIHVWLNDFVTGGDGTNVNKILADLGMSKNRINSIGVGKSQRDFISTARESESEFLTKVV